MARKALTPLGLVSLSADPSGTFNQGEMYWNTTTKKIRVYNGTAWEDVGSGGGATRAFGFFLK